MQRSKLAEGLQLAIDAAKDEANLVSMEICEVKYIGDLHLGGGHLDSADVVQGRRDEGCGRHEELRFKPCEPQVGERMRPS